MSSLKMRGLTLALILGLLLAVAPASAQGGEFTLTVLHTNDVHARVLQFNNFGTDCSEEDAAEGSCFGGVARRKTAIDAVRAEGGNVILVDGGDQFQGTLFYNQYKGEEVQVFMTLLGYDGMTVGNHEFDDGPGNLASFIQGVDFPVISANIDASAEPSLAGILKPSAVIEVGGEQIGLVGATAEETGVLSSAGPNVTFLDAVDPIQAAVDDLTAQGVNKIVLMSHLGFPRDLEVATAVTGLDVIVAGHTNTYLSNTDEDASGPYPVVATAPDGNPVLVVSDFTWGKYLGRLDVTFDADGVPVEWSGNPITLDASIEEDPEVLAEALKMAEPLVELKNTRVGEAAVDLDGERASCRNVECNMGNLIADAMLWKTQAEGTQIAIQNGGGIRASIPAGEVSLGDVLTVLPFGNTIATFGLSGADVVASLENGVSQVSLTDPGESAGRFPQVAGLRYSWDPTKEPGSRIVSVEVKNADGSYSPIDPAATYKVVSNNFMRTGGDGYSLFAENAIDPYDAGASLDEAVAEYIGLNSPVAPEVEGRITRLEGAAAAAPEALPQSGAGAPLWPVLLLIVAGGGLVGVGVAGRRYVNR